VLSLSSKGGKSGADVQCKACRGQGIVIKVRQIGPGMIQQMQTTCDSCNGEGTTMAEKDKCKTCKGARVVKEKKTLEARTRTRRPLSPVLAPH
jgi:DnaJ-class molecular chaperone